MYYMQWESKACCLYMFGKIETPPCDRPMAPLWNLMLLHICAGDIKNATGFVKTADAISFNDCFNKKHDKLILSFRPPAVKYIFLLNRLCSELISVLQPTFESIDLNVILPFSFWLCQLKNKSSFYCITWHKKLWEPSLYVHMKETNN